MGRNAKAYTFSGGRGNAREREIFGAAIKTRRHEVAKKQTVRSGEPLIFTDFSEDGGEVG
jgi:hypothetical protein